MRRYLAFLITLGSALPAQTATPRPEVHIIATGGTIANAGPQRRTVVDLVAAVPGLDSLAQLTVEQFSNKSSETITTDDWRALAARVNEVFRTRPGLAGVIVTHGTDTMEETAYFLDLTVRGCRPVIVTGAMRRAVDAGADGPANLRNAVRVAIAPHARSRGTMLLMQDELFAARGVAKVNTVRLDAFAAPDVGPLGVADPDSIAFARAAPPCTGDALAGTAAARFDIDALPPLPRVDVLYTYIGADSALVDAAVVAGARGLVVAGAGRGSVPPAMRTAMIRAARAGVAIVMSSRTGSGRVPPYSGTLPGEPTLPIVGAQSLSPQQARVLLMLALAAKEDVRVAFSR